MNMADQESLNFDDLEPEGAEDTQDEEEAPPMESAILANQELDEFLLGPLGEYEFGELEALADFAEVEQLEPAGHDSPGNGFDQPGRHPLADQVAYMVLKWGGRARTGPLLSGNGRTSTGPKPVRPRGTRLELEYLDEPETDSFGGAVAGLATAAWSAALREEYELMDRLALAAAAAKNRAEAESLIAASVPLAIRLAPTVYRALWPILPALIQGAVGAARLLHSRPATRPLLREMPGILHRTVEQLVRQTERGRPLNRSMAVKALARQAMAALQDHSIDAPPAPRPLIRSRLRSYDRY